MSEKATAWGYWVFEIAEATADGSMPAKLEKLGEIEENGITINTTEGTKLQIKLAGGAIYDEASKEPEMEIDLSVVDIPEAIASKFWNTATNANGGFDVKSMVSNTKFAVRLRNTEVKDAKILEIPRTSVTLTPLITDDKGYMSSVKFKILKSEKGTFFSINPQKVENGTED